MSVSLQQAQVSIVFCIPHKRASKTKPNGREKKEEKKRKETHLRKRCTPIASCSFLLSFVHRLLFLPFQLGNISRCMPGIRALFVYVHQFFSLSFLSNLIFLLYPPSASSSVLPGPPFSRWSFARCHVLFGCCTLYTEHQISEFLQICKLKLKGFFQKYFCPN